MSGSSSVPRPTFTPQGFQAPSEADILDGVQADYSAAFGGNLNPALETPQGQLASSETAVIGNKNDQFLYFTNQVDPAFAEGRMQDGIARIYFIERFPARPTVVPVVIGGLPSVLITAGTLIQAEDGNLYAAIEDGQIGSNGTVTMSFACTVPGPIPCPPQVFTIYQAVPGWDTALSTVDGALGRLVEGRAEFEERRSASVALNGRGSLPSVRAAVLSVPNVLDAYVTQNVTGAPVTIGGFTLVAHSIYVAVLGGTSAAIGRAIWNAMDPGCDYNGGNTVTVTDTSYDPPYPSYVVKFQRPDLIPIHFQVTIAAGTAVPADAQAQIQAAIVDAFGGGDGMQRARIGGTIYASRFYAPVAKLGGWAQIISIGIRKGPTGPFVNSVVMDIDEAPTAAPENITMVTA